MSIEVSQLSSQPKKLTAKQHIVDSACIKCGAFIRNIYTNACIECDRIRQRKAYRAKNPKPVQIPASTKISVGQVAKPARSKVIKQRVNPSHVPLQIAKSEVNKNSLLNQPVTFADKIITSQRLQADYEAFIASGGKVNQGAA